MEKAGADRAPFYWRRRMVASRGAQEDPFPPPKGAMKMKRLISEAVDKVPVGDGREYTWFSLFDEVGTVKLLKERIWRSYIIWGEPEQGHLAPNLSGGAGW